MNKEQFVKWCMENVDHEVLLHATLEMAPALLKSYLEEDTEGNSNPYVFQPAKEVQ
jgi:hypothetical protein